MPSMTTQEHPDRRRTPPHRLPAGPSGRPWLVRWLLLAIAVLCVVLGVIGIVLPGLPTTPFIILAAWAAARSSPRFHAWLLRNRLFGPLLVNWENGHRVGRRAKWSATLAMGVCSVLVLWLVQPGWVAGLAVVSMLAVLLWLWQRPEPPQ